MPVTKVFQSVWVKARTDSSGLFESRTNIELGRSATSTHAALAHLVLFRQCSGDPNFGTMFRSFQNAKTRRWE